VDQTRGAPDGQPGDDALGAARAGQSASADRDGRLTEQASASSASPQESSACFSPSDSYSCPVRR
jgi:hypothetical protein